MKSMKDEVEDAIAEGRHIDALKAQAQIMARKHSKRLAEAELQELLRMKDRFGIRLEVPCFFRNLSTFRAVEEVLKAVEKL